MQIISVATGRIGAGPAIRAGDRTGGLDALAARLDHLPPIVVQAGTWRIVDGARRLAAARAVGRSTVEVEVVDVGDDELLAERARRNSGKDALTRSERRAVALELLAQHPHWSDRRIGSCVGVAGTTVGRLREHPGAALPHLNTEVRIGADGRRYSRDTTAAKAQAVLLHALEPHRSLNSLAREVGLSPATVKRALDTQTTGNGDAASGAEPDREDHNVATVADTLAATSPRSRRERGWWGRRLLAALARLLTRRVARKRGPTRRPD